MDEMDDDEREQYDRIIGIMQQLDRFAEDLGEMSYMNANFDAGYVSAASTILREMVDPTYVGLKAYDERRMNERLLKALQKS